MPVEREYTLATISWPKSIWTRGEEDEALVEELQVSIRGENVTQADFSFQWWQLVRGDPPAVLLRAYHDSWDGARAVLAGLPSGQALTPAEIISWLNQMGFSASRYHGQEQRATQDQDRRAFERLRRLHPEWFGHVKGLP